MKRLVLCFDGTWNEPSDPTLVTNVVKIADTISLRDAKGVPQICYYNSGVGTGGPIDQYLGGIFGVGLKANVKRGLAFLTQNYDAGGDGQPPDEIYLFGFSRGAYTARAVAGVLSVVGIPWEIRDSETHWETYRQIAKLKAKQRDLEPTSKKYKRLEDEVAQIRDQRKKLTTKPSTHAPENIRIKCIGVFDTVGSYGVPAGFGLGALPHIFTYWTRGFHSRRIGDHVDVALHAMAIDEMRRPFSPTFWMRKPEEQLGDNQVVEQMWFPGVHSNVGGGYADTRLSDMALAWMISRVQQFTELDFNRSAIEDEVWPCAAGTVYRTSKGGWMSLARAVLPEFKAAKPKSRRGRMQRTRVNEYVHWSVKERCDFEKAPVDKLGFQKYAPKNLRKTDVYSDPSTLEQELCRPERGWRADKCPLKDTGAPCVCMQQVPQVIAGRSAKPRSEAA
jgi:uncharacterized protein (DUF2235 family)